MGKKSYAQSGDNQVKNQSSVEKYEELGNHNGLSGIGFSHLDQKRIYLEARRNSFHSRRQNLNNNHPVSSSTRYVELGSHNGLSGIGFSHLDQKRIYLEARLNSIQGRQQSESPYYRGLLEEGAPLPKRHRSMSSSEAAFFQQQQEEEKEPKTHPKP